MASTSAIVTSHFNADQVALIKSTIMSGKSTPTDSDLALFGMICQRSGLDPFAKQIYAIERGGKWTFQISIDGLRAIADRTGEYAGSDEPLFDEGLDLYTFEETDRKIPKVCKLTVWRNVKGIRCPFVGIARYADYAKTAARSQIWAEMPTHMMAIRAECHALRKGFPQVQQVISELHSDEPIVEAEIVQSAIESASLTLEQHNYLEELRKERGITSEAYQNFIQQRYGASRNSEVPAQFFEDLANFINNGLIES